MVNEGTTLVDVIAKDVSESQVDHVGGSVVAHDGGTAITVNVEGNSVTNGDGGGSIQEGSYVEGVTSKGLDILNFEWGLQWRKFKCML